MSRGERGVGGVGVLGCLIVGSFAHVASQPLFYLAWPLHPIKGRNTRNGTAKNAAAYKPQQEQEAGTNTKVTTMTAMTGNTNGRDCRQQRKHETHRLRQEAERPQLPHVAETHDPFLVSRGLEQVLAGRSIPSAVQRAIHEALCQVADHHRDPHRPERNFFRNKGWGGRTIVTAWTFCPPCRPISRNNNVKGFGRFSRPGGLMYR